MFRDFATARLSFSPSRLGALAVTSGADAKDAKDVVLAVLFVLDQPSDEESRFECAGCGAPLPSFCACLRFLYGSRLVSLVGQL
jgi:hypothetical protein